MLQQVIMNTVERNAKIESIKKEIIDKKKIQVINLEMKIM